MADGISIHLLTPESAMGFVNEVDCRPPISASVSGWLSRDPLGEYEGVNLYEYCGDDAVNAIDEYGLTSCQGTARVLAGNPSTIGTQGGFPGVLVGARSAGVDPQQWGGKGNLRPNIGNISGTFTDDHGVVLGSFNGITEVIGGKSPTPGMNVRDALKKRYPGRLLIELPSSKKDLGIVNVTINVPAGVPCPEGTN